MSVEKAKEFLLRLKEKAPDEAFIEKWKSAESEDERMQLYVELADSMGYDLPVTEIKEALTGLDDEHIAKTLAAKKEMEALEDDELEQVAGGFYYYAQDGMGISIKVEGCWSDFVDANCTWEDACDFVYMIYRGCTGEYYSE